MTQQYDTASPQPRIGIVTVHLCLPLATLITCNGITVSYQLLTVDGFISPSHSLLPSVLLIVASVLIQTRPYTYSNNGAV